MSRGVSQGALRTRQDWFSYACPKFVAASMPDLDSFSATDRWVEDPRTWTLDNIGIYWINGTIKTHKNPKNWINGTIKTPRTMTVWGGTWASEHFQTIRFWGLAYFQANPDLRVDGGWELATIMRAVSFKGWRSTRRIFLLWRKKQSSRVSFHSISFRSDPPMIGMESCVWTYLQALQKMVQGKDFDSHEDSTTMGIWFIWSHSLSNNILQYSLFTWVNLPLQRGLQFWRQLWIRLEHVSR